jgi:hypothetical protein
MMKFTFRTTTQICLATISIAFAGASSAQDDLRAALLDVWPRYVGVRAVRDYANQCNANDVAANNRMFAQWQSAQGLTDQIDDLLEKALTAAELVELKRAAQSSIVSKVGETFPGCLTATQFSAIATGPTADLKKSSATSLAVVQRAMTSGVTSPTTSKSPPIASNVASDNASKTGAQPRAPAPASASQPVDQSALDAVYINQTTSFGVGGMMTFDYDAYAVFNDGTICRDIETIATGRTGKTASRCGQWTRAGNGFSARWLDGKTSTLGGSTFYKTFPASAGDHLNGKYMSIGGGGNTALGGTAMVVVAKTYLFSADGSFQLASSSGGSNTGVAVSSSKSETGRYVLDRHVIELRFNDGNVLRTGFYFFPASGKKTHKSIGIGGSTYTLRDR